MPPEGRDENYAAALAEYGKQLLHQEIRCADAGVSKAATIEETTVEDFDKLFAVNACAVPSAARTSAATTQNEGSENEKSRALVQRRA